MDSTFPPVLPLQHSATHCNTLQLTATHCNSLQLTATHSQNMDSAPTAVPPGSAQSPPSSETDERKRNVGGNWREKRQVGGGG